MQFGKPMTALALTLALALGAPAMAAENHDHGGHEATVAALVLDEGAKWRGDQNMIDGMTAIRTVMAANLDAIHANAVTPAQSKGLAADVGRQLDFMIENCDLEPAADEQFHLVLAQVMDGASALEAGDVETGAVAIVQALNAYGAHFEHPGWEPLAH